MVNFVKTFALPISHYVFRTNCCLFRTTFISVNSDIYVEICCPISHYFYVSRATVHLQIQIFMSNFRSLQEVRLNVMADDPADDLINFYYILHSIITFPWYIF